MTEFLRPSHTAAGPPSSSSNPDLDSQGQWSGRSTSLERSEFTSDGTSTVTDGGSSLTSAGHAFDRKSGKMGLFEAVVDRLSRRLTREPLKEALRLSHALLQLHESESQEPCTQQMDESIPSTGGLDVIAKRLLWSCNGVCPRCGAVYIPKVLDDPPDAVARHVKKLASYLRSPLYENIILGCTTVGIVIQSRIFSSYFLQEIGVLASLETLINGVLRFGRSWRSTEAISRDKLIKSLRGLVDTLAASALSQDTTRDGPSATREIRELFLLTVTVQLLQRKGDFETHKIFHSTITRIWTYVFESDHSELDTTTKAQNCILASATSLDSGSYYLFFPVMAEHVYLTARHLHEFIQLYKPGINIEEIVAQLRGPARMNLKARLLAVKDFAARDLLDTFQFWLDMHINHADRRSIIRHLVDIAGASNELPRVLFIKGVELESVHPTAFGGFADVFRGMHDNRVIALKRLRISDSNPARILLHKKFCQECLLWRQLSHPNILPFLGIDADTFGSKSLAMVAPWMERGTIMTFIRTADYDAALDRQRLLIEIAEGLLYLHSQEITHGDLHGSNVFVTQDRHACLADFGLSVVDDITNSQGPAASVAVSPWRWLAPELVMLDTTIVPQKTPESDVFSFGRLCLAVCTTRPPFHGFTEAAVLIGLDKNIRPKRPTPQDCNGHVMSDTLWSLANQCWEMQPADRPRIKDALISLRSGDPSYTGLHEDPPANRGTDEPSARELFNKYLRVFRSKQRLR